MATLTRIEDLIYSSAIYTFDKKPKATRTDASIKRRSGTYTVLGISGGVQPFGNYTAPTDIRPFSYQFRILVPKTGDVQKALDLAGAAFQRAIGRGRMHRLVRIYGGAEHVIVAQCIDVQDVTTSADNWRHRDFAVTWELTTPWRDRVSRGPHTVGDGSQPILGSTTLLLGFGNLALTSTTINNFTILADGTDGLAAPTWDDDAPVLTLVGPFGGDGGVVIANATATIKDTAGSLQQTFLIYKQALTAGQTLVIDTGARTAYLNGADVWANLSVPDYQPMWMSVQAGIANLFQVYCYGTPASFVVDASHSKFSIAWYGQYW